MTHWLLVIFRSLIFLSLKFSNIRLVMVFKNLAIYYSSWIFEEMLFFVPFSVAETLYKVLGIVLILASKYIASETAAAIGVPTYLNLYCSIVILQDSFTYSIDQICNLSGRNDKYVHRLDFVLVHKSFTYHSF